MGHAGVKRSPRRGGALPRALKHNAALVEEAAREPLVLPVLALGGDTVGDALERQLEPITRDLSGEVLPDCGHIVPADAPGLLVDRLSRFLERSPAFALGRTAGADR